MMTDTLQPSVSLAVSKPISVPAVFIGGMGLLCCALFYEAGSTVREFVAVMDAVMLGMTLLADACFLHTVLRGKSIARVLGGIWLAAALLNTVNVGWFIAKEIDRVLG